MPALIDIFHTGIPRVMGIYVLEGDEPAIVDCGPSTRVDTLTAGLAERGLALTDLRHILLTHIHPDHAGAAGLLVGAHPGLQVHVSEIGAPHLVHPERVERSARRLFGAEFERLLGAIPPVPAENVRLLGERVLDLEVVPAPGHASHHVVFLASDGACYVGDVAGVRNPPSRYVAPVAPPPEIDLEAWERTLDALLERQPTALCLAHFGVVEDVAEHLERLRGRLRAWADRVRAGASEGEFVAEAEAELAREVEPQARAPHLVWPFAVSHAGLMRYWEKKRESEAA